MGLSANHAPVTGPLVDDQRKITRWWLQWLTTASTWILDVSSGITGILPAGNGGTGRASLTAHDVLVGNGSSPVTLVAPGAAGTVLTSNGATSDPSFQAASGGDVTHTGTLTANELVLGNGGADIVSLGAAGTPTTVLHGNPAGAPSFSAVDLAADVSGNLAVAHLNNGTSASSGTFWRGDGTWSAPADPGSWLPLVNGSEPPGFLTDGDGGLIAVPYV